MKKNGPRIPSEAVWSLRRPKATAIIIATLFCIITPALTMPTSNNTDPPPHKACQSDYECPENFYCYTRRSPQQYCAPCYLCSRLNRESAANGCAKSRAECGPCLPRYHELGIICSRVPDDLGHESHDSNAKTEADSTEAAFSSWILCTAGTIVAVAVVLIIAILILWKWSKWCRGPTRSTIEKDIELRELTACNSSPSAPPPPYYEECEQANPRLAQPAFIGKETTQRRNPISQPPELLNNQEAIINEGQVPPDDPQDNLLDAIEQELQPQQQEEAGAAALVPDVDNVVEGDEDQDMLLHEESGPLENPNDVNHEGAEEPPEDRSAIQGIQGENSPAFGLMLNLRFNAVMNWPEREMNFEEEMPQFRSRSDSGVVDTSGHSSMDQIVPTVDYHVQNLDTGSALHAGRRLGAVYQGRFSVSLELMGYASNNDEGFSTDETGEERSFNLNGIASNDHDPENRDRMEVSEDSD